MVNTDNYSSIAYSNIMIVQINIILTDEIIRYIQYIIYKYINKVIIINKSLFRNKKVYYNI